LATGHIEYTEPGGTALITGQLHAGYTIRELNHSHPNNTPYPSGLDSRKSDVGFAKKISDWYGNKYPDRKNSPSFNIYLPKGKKYIPFSGNSVKSDYFK